MKFILESLTNDKSHNTFSIKNEISKAKFFLNDLAEEISKEERIKNTSIDSTKILEGKRILEKYCKKENITIYKDLEVI